MIDHEPQDLDSLLNASAPPTSPHGPELVAALEAMARDARPTRRRVRRPLAIGAGSLALVLAGGAAAAAAWLWPVPGAAANYTYALPSGAQCRTAVLVVDGRPDAVAAAKEFLNRKDLSDVIDVDAALADVQAGPTKRTLDDGTVVDAGPGTDYWVGADTEYQFAYNNAVWHALSDYLVAHGYENSGMTERAAMDCPGIEIPDWMKTAGG
jgi:hypothetical protein